MSQKAMTALIFLVAGLITVVIFVGLAQRTLNTTGVVVALSSIVSGYFASLALRAGAKNKDGNDKDGDDNP